MQRSLVVYHRIFLKSLVFSQYTHNPLVEYAYQEIQVTNEIFHGIPLHNYFITCHRKYSGQHNQYDVRAEHDGKVGCNTEQLLNEAE